MGFARPSRAGRSWLWLVAVLILLLLALVVVMLPWQYAPRYQRLGYGGEARYNDFYALGRWLEQLAIDTASVAYLGEIDALDADAALVMTTPLYALAPDEREWLLRWVSQGGRLIYSPRAGDPALPLLSSTEPTAITLTLPPHPVEVTVAGQSFEVEFTPYAANVLALAQPPGTSPYLQRHPYGAGELIMVASLSPFTNHHLDRYQHALLFLQLLRTPEPPTLLWLQYLPALPRWWELLLRYAWAPLLGLLMTLGFILWRANLSFGPPLWESANEERSPLSHLRASGLFYWQQQRAPMLVEAARWWNSRVGTLPTDNDTPSHASAPLDRATFVALLQTLQAIHLHKDQRPSPHSQKTEQ